MKSRVVPRSFRMTVREFVERFPELVSMCSAPFSSFLPDDLVIATPKGKNKLVVDLLAFDRSDQRETI